MTLINNKHIINNKHFYGFSMFWCGPRVLEKWYKYDRSTPAPPQALATAEVGQ